ncbi:MAG: 4-alpha-glucanotransferase [Candidatus Omnitrophica bacterium CG11_big_fil_rev_8_21_14_0_20_41_12]|nr:MAG: 4-alpha-glucanotransferase [Candidatus Omnitrophica bacterium CG11_big_fil_rev_8_21_14_0_20_41_12]
MSESSLQDYLSKSISKDNWKNAGFKKRAGVLIPLFSVYSKKSFGIGDLADLKLIVDWAKLISNSIIQLLPMNEVGSLFCPYDAVSSFALEPSYISLKSFPELRNKKFSSSSKNSNFVDYSVKKEKLRLLWDVYLATDLSEALDFEDFQQKNFYWLSDFALFKVLKDRYQGRPWYEWEDNFKNRSRQALQEFKQNNIEKITFQMWLQWILFKQFKEAKDYAAQNNIFIKGDLPVLVSRDSADVWSHPQFFKLDFAAGAPPDMYCAKGQRWGMPTYNWENIAQDNYRYIKEKLKYAQEFYNILRIDHVVGLFRIWSIPYQEPEENQGLNGFFDPLDERIWKEHGRNILTFFTQNTTMLLCAEDLGIIPKCCVDTLQEFGIPGNDVQRWVKDWNKRHDFLLPGEYRELAVTTLSTHDTTNWKAWWKYEAGTVDQALFIRKCLDRKIDFAKVNLKLFNAKLSFHGRLRWNEEIDSIDKLLGELGKNKEEVGDFIDLYENTYQEKEKLWKVLGCRGEISEEANSQLLTKVTEFILRSQAVFCINSIEDYLGLADVFKGDPYQYRINVPGTISPKNWSLKLPFCLEEMLIYPLNQKIRKLISDSGRG